MFSIGPQRIRHLGEVEMDKMKLNLKHNATTYIDLHASTFRSQRLPLIILSIGPKGIVHLREVEMDKIKLL